MWWYPVQTPLYAGLHDGRGYSCSCAAFAGLPPSGRVLGPAAGESQQGRAGHNNNAANPSLAPQGFAAHESHDLGHRHAFSFEQRHDAGSGPDTVVLTRVMRYCYRKDRIGDVNFLFFPAVSYKSYISELLLLLSIQVMRQDILSLLRWFVLQGIAAVRP